MRNDFTSTNDSHSQNGKMDNIFDKMYDYIERNQQMFKNSRLQWLKTLGTTGHEAEQVFRWNYLRTNPDIGGGPIGPTDAWDTGAAVAGHDPLAGGMPMLLPTGGGATCPTGA